MTTTDDLAKKGFLLSKEALSDLDDGALIFEDGTVLDDAATQPSTQPHSAQQPASQPPPTQTTQRTQPGTQQSTLQSTAAQLALQPTTLHTSVQDAKEHHHLVYSPPHTQQMTGMLKPEQRQPPPTNDEPRTTNAESQNNHDRQQTAHNAPQQRSSVNILYSENENPGKISVDDFASYYLTRFKTIERILRGREDLQGVLSISRLAKKQKENASIIGMVMEKSETKNQNIMLKVEDPTGSTLVLVTQKNQEAYAVAQDLVLDDIIGVSGQTGTGIFFANNILLPGFPGKELKKSPVEEYAVFTGDIHIGSKAFLQEDFERFLSWLAGESGSDVQRTIAKKVKYLFLVGDLVDGIGVYPGQEEELTILEITEQYQALAQLLKHIPEHIQIIICPGNHDAGRISEPQLPLYKDFAAPIYALPNVTMISNPGTVTIGELPGFSGFDVLLYHGYSFIYYADNVPSIRDVGGMNRSDLIIKYLLQRRHLAPTHTSNLHIPYPKKDPLILLKIPDIITTGHIHKISVVPNYKGITLLNTSCWTHTTEAQEKRGITPQPGKVPIINLQTREIKILNFEGGEA
jgi:DNA polymerase II small subunit